MSTSGLIHPQAISIVGWQSYSRKLSGMQTSPKLSRYFSTCNEYIYGGLTIAEFLIIGTKLFLSPPQMQHY